MLLSTAIRLGLCPWILLLPVLALLSAPELAATPGYGLRSERSCTVSAAQLRDCIQRCDAATPVLPDTPDDAPIRVHCSLRTPVPQLNLFAVGMPDFQPQWVELGHAHEPTADPVGVPHRPPVPPPKRPLAL